MSMRLEGLKGLQRQIDELGAALAVKALAAAARKAFRPVLDAAVAAAPVDTGLLRDSIRIAVEKSSGDAVVRVGLKVAAVKGAAKLGRRTMSAHWRWHFVELGTRHSAARPFLRPALERNADGVVEAFRAEVVRMLDRAIRRKRAGK